MIDDLRADGILISPGYEYESVERDIFLTGEQIHEKFKAIRNVLGPVQGSTPRRCSSSSPPASAS